MMHTKPHWYGEWLSYAIDRSWGFTTASGSSAFAQCIAECDLLCVARRYSALLESVSADGACRELLALESVGVDVLVESTLKVRPASPLRLRLRTLRC